MYMTIIEFKNSSISKYYAWVIIIQHYEERITNKLTNIGLKPVCIMIFFVISFRSYNQRIILAGRQWIRLYPFIFFVIIECLGAFSLVIFSWRIGVIWTTTSRWTFSMMFFFQTTFISMVGTARMFVSWRWIFWWTIGFVSTSWFLMVPNFGLI